MQKPEMSPAPGERLLRFVGDHVLFTLRSVETNRLADGCMAFLRTNLGRAKRVREEIIRSYTSKLPTAGAAWRDLPMHLEQGFWRVELPLVEVGFFQAKAYLVDRDGRQVWSDGANVGITVHPNEYRTAATVYCAFVRMFGPTKTLSESLENGMQIPILKLDQAGYAAIPPSGKLRDLTVQIPHIVEKLGCRIVHLLPVNPVPTTYARFGRFGSPYASQDLTAVDPALVEFDRRTTGIDQFEELAYSVHEHGAKVFLDIVTNHTGWGSTLQEQHPDWFLRLATGEFASPGAWGVTWEDLVELDHRKPASWEHLAEVFLTWCRRGVDGFRCDAGYKVPMPAWRYITSCVRQEFPETIFLLEGLGGSWQATEDLLTDGGMQWAYSELFQNYSGTDVANYLDYAHRQSQRAGIYLHYSETHDNSRLAALGRTWSLLRNRLCALTSVSGGYGFTCGVEWLATEKIRVHGSTGMNWGNENNIVSELAKLNGLLANHPCFFDDAVLTRLSQPASAVYALRRDSQEGLDRVLIVVNTDPKQAQSWTLDGASFKAMGQPTIDLLGQAAPTFRLSAAGSVVFALDPGACHCLAAAAGPTGLSGDLYRRLRAAAAFAVEALNHMLPAESIGPFSWRTIGEQVDRDPEAVLIAISQFDCAAASRDPLRAINLTNPLSIFPQMVTWNLVDARRITPIPPDHWLLIRDPFRFRASLSGPGTGPPDHVKSIQVQDGFAAFFPPRGLSGDASLVLERYAGKERKIQGELRFLSATPDLTGLRLTPETAAIPPSDTPLALLTNGRGGMAHLCVDFGRIHSKYDCLLGANLHPDVPVDRHILVKRARVWVIADRFLSPLDGANLAEFSPGPPAHWQFIANAGDGRTVEIHLDLDMLEGLNTTVLRFSRPTTAARGGAELPDHCVVRLTLRVDLEDRNFHWETKRNAGADYHFSSHCRPLEESKGFEFAPDPNRTLRVFADKGAYHPEVEWSENIPHPVEQSRGQTAQGDAYSPGWFDLPMALGTDVTVVLCADRTDPSPDQIREFALLRRGSNKKQIAQAALPETDDFGHRLVVAAHQFVARRGPGKTVIAGYPWFLDWGRDTLICARGLLAAGMQSEVEQMLVTFGRFEQQGTLPNSIYGEDASNRDTSDAPLWFGIVCEEAAARAGDDLYNVSVDSGGRTLRDILRNIAEGYLRGTPNGIQVDPNSSLVWSPTHFTWMDTNYPAGTPREGYPVEIQALWIRLLRQLARIDPAQRARWERLAAQSHSSLTNLFWIADRGYLADCLLASSGQTAAVATVDTALRSNYLFAIALGLITGEPARRSVEQARRYLIIPGALRSLAPLPTSPPLPIRGQDGRLLNDPQEPYWGHYEGDEDSRRKPAYHNGTAWTWTFPTFCEALALAWDRDSVACAAARAYLASMDRLLVQGCRGQIPEILDGDAPHVQRGCDAQAWGVTEALRVWKWLQPKPSSLG